MRRRLASLAVATVAAMPLGTAVAGPSIAEPNGDGPQHPGSPHLRLVIEERGPVADGRSYGTVGAYERIAGRVEGRLDPRDPANVGIVNLDKAPRDADGLVAYSTEFEIHAPAQAARGNRTMLYEVVNRGRSLFGPYVDDEGDLLYREGFTLVWSGWQGDLKDTDEILAPSLPIATDDGRPIVGTVRDEFVDKGTAPWTGDLSYPVADTDRARATLTVRQNQDDPRTPVTTWRYTGAQAVEVTPQPGFDSGAIYEFGYPGKDPTVLGIGFAATRDLSSFLRFGRRDAAGTPNPLTGDVRHGVMFGVSQSGRFVRDFIHQGFNRDTAGRKVFDGAMPVIAGSRKTWVNEAFGQPGRWSKQHEEHYQVGDQFPFTYPVIKDPVSGRTDGIYARCRATSTCPKLMHVDGEYELWGARGSLVSTDGNPAGPRDLRMPADVRLYMVAGTPHGGANLVVPDTTDKGLCTQLNSPLGSRPVVRSLLPRLQQWVAFGVRPPRSNYGSVSAGTLVTPDRASTGFPDLPGVEYTGLVNPLHVTDYTTVPPTTAAAYEILVPRTDKDGNAIAGIRQPALQAPIATYTGWNVRAKGHAPGEMCPGAGSYLPFAATEQERRAAGDPRHSLQERYGDEAGYVRAYAKAAAGLVRRGYLLPADARALVEEARTRAAR